MEPPDEDGSKWLQTFWHVPTQFHLFLSTEIAVKTVSTLGIGNSFQHLSLQLLYRTVQFFAVFESPPSADITSNNRLSSSLLKVGFFPAFLSSSCERFASSTSGTFCRTALSFPFGPAPLLQSTAKKQWESEKRKVASRKTLLPLSETREDMTPDFNLFRFMQGKILLMWRKDRSYSSKKKYINGTYQWSKRLRDYF